MRRRRQEMNVLDEIKKWAREETIRKVEEVWRKQILTEIERYAKAQLGEDAEVRCIFFPYQGGEGAFIRLNIERDANDFALYFYLTLPLEISIITRTPKFRESLVYCNLVCNIIYDNLRYPRWKITNECSIADTKIHILDKVLGYYNVSLIGDYQNVNLEKIGNYLYHDELQKWVDFITYAHSENMMNIVAFINRSVITLQEKLKQLKIETRKDNATITITTLLNPANRILTIYEKEEDELNVEFSISLSPSAYIIIHFDDTAQVEKQQMQLEMQLAFTVNYNARTNQTSVEVTLLLAPPTLEEITTSSIINYNLAEVNIATWNFLAGDEITLPHPAETITNEVINKVRKALTDVIVPAIRFHQQ